MFLHGGLFHLLGNMLYLWIFGNNVEDYLGHVKFIIFYLISGFFAAFIHTLSDLNSPIPMIGASGAIAGVLGAYLVLFPRANVSTLFIFIIFFKIIKVPAVLILGLWFLVQLLNAGTGRGIGGLVCSCGGVSNRGGFDPDLQVDPIRRNLDSGPFPFSSRQYPESLFFSIDPKEFDRSRP